MLAGIRPQNAKGLDLHNPCPVRHRSPQKLAVIREYTRPSFRTAGFRESGLPDRLPPCIMSFDMEIARLGKKGQISLPKAVLKRLGLAGETLLLVDVTPEGGILLKPAGVYPIEIYSE